MAKTKPTKLSDLTPDPTNPRDIDLAALEGLKFSVEEFGDLSGITWNERTGELVCGHQRVRALAEQYGDLEILDLGPGDAPRFFLVTPKGGRFPVRDVDWDRKKQRAANLAANNPHIAGHFTDALQGQLKDLAAEDQELLRNLRLDELVVEDIAPAPDPALNEAPPLPAEPKTKLGDLYILGRHRLFCGDCRFPENMAALMGGAQADLMVTDPPYNVDYVGKTKEAKKIQNDKMDNAAFLAFLQAVFGALYPHVKPGGPAYVFHADSEGENFRRAFRESGFLLKQCLPWVKDSMVLGRQDFQWQHEPILYGWKDGAAHPWYADRKQTTLWRFDRPTRSEDHPTMKPVEMIGYALRCSSRPGDLVLDTFGGSGTTLVACERARRTCCTMELDPKYCDVIVRRWEELTKQKAVLAGNTPPVTPGPEPLPSISPVAAHAEAVAEWGNIDFEDHPDPIRHTMPFISKLTQPGVVGAPPVPGPAGHFELRVDDRPKGKLKAKPAKAKRLTLAPKAKKKARK